MLMTVKQISIIRFFQTVLFHPLLLLFYASFHTKIYDQVQDTSGDVVVSKLDELPYSSEFEAHRVAHSYDLVPHWNPNTL